MQTAASFGRRILVDRWGFVVWKEEPANHEPPTSAHPGSQIICTHEPLTAGFDVNIGDKYPPQRGANEVA